MTADGPLLFYDGTCGFCARSVQFVLRHEGRRHRPVPLRFASLDGAAGRVLHERHPELRLVDSLIWYEPGTDDRGERVLVRSDGVLAVAAYLGGVWGVLGRLGRLVPRVVRDGVYDWVARNRYRIAGRADACLVPTSEQRARFLT